MYKWYAAHQQRRQTPTNLPFAKALVVSLNFCLRVQAGSFLLIHFLGIN